MESERSHARSPSGCHQHEHHSETWPGNFCCWLGERIAHRRHACDLFLCSFARGFHCAQSSREKKSIDALVKSSVAGRCQLKVLVVGTFVVIVVVGGSANIVCLPTSI
jgi:hypothetical protein